MPIWKSSSVRPIWTSLIQSDLHLTPVENMLSIFCPPRDLDLSFSPGTLSRGRTCCRCFAPVTVTSAEHIVDVLDLSSSPGIKSQEEHAVNVLPRDLDLRLCNGIQCLGENMLSIIYPPDLDLRICFAPMTLNSADILSRGRTCCKYFAPWHWPQMVSWYSMSGGGHVVDVLPPWPWPLLESWYSVPGENMLSMFPPLTLTLAKKSWYSVPEENMLSMFYPATLNSAGILVLCPGGKHVVYVLFRSPGQCDPRTGPWRRTQVVITTSENIWNDRSRIFTHRQPSI